MLVNLNGNNLNSKCLNCKGDLTTDLTDYDIKKNEFNENENLVINCDCGGGTVYNMNVPDEIDTTLSVYEQQQRQVIKAIKNKYIERV